MLDQKRFEGLFALAEGLQKVDPGEFDMSDSQHCALHHARTLGIAPAVKNEHHAGDCGCPNCTNWTVTAKRLGLSVEEVHDIYGKDWSTPALAARELRNIAKRKIARIAA